jgi:hypothetical protein
VDFIKKIAEKIAGLPIVMVIATWLLFSDAKELTVLDTIAIFVVSWLFYELGSCWDWLLFDVLYAPRKAREEGRGRLARVPLLEMLEKRREAAATTFHCPITGIYAKAKQLFGETEDWELKFFLQISKAARTLLFPFIVILYCSLLQLHTSDESAATKDAVKGAVAQASTNQWLDWFSPRNPILLAFQGHVHSGFTWMVVHQGFVLATIVLALLVYILFRILHLRKLYDLVSNARVSHNVVWDPVERKKREILSVNSKILAVRTISHMRRYEVFATGSTFSSCEGPYGRGHLHFVY